MRYSGLLAVLGTILLASCSSGAPLSFAGITPRPLPDGFTCAVQQLNGLGYTVDDANKDAGFVRGTKDTTQGASRLLSGNSYKDLLTVSVFEDPTSHETRIRATAARLKKTGIGLLSGNVFSSGKEQGIDPSEEGTSDANVLLKACGVTDGKLVTD